MKKGSRLLQMIIMAAVCMPVAGLAVDITTSALPGGMEMVAYSAQMEATNGTPPYTWSVASGFVESEH